MKDDVIPAAPGWYVLHYFPSKYHGQGYFRIIEPILAWRLWRNSVGQPITLRAHEGQIHFIKSPDGMVWLFPEGVSWDGEENAAREMAAREEAGMTLAD
jgi:hypothetical protein